MHLQNVIYNLRYAMILLEAHKPRFKSQKSPALPLLHIHMLAQTHVHTHTQIWVEVRDDIFW